MLLAVPLTVTAAGVALFWTGLPSALPPCPTYQFGHFYCPGCGATRAAAALAHGNIPLALRQNCAVVVLPALALLFYLEQVFKSFGKSLRFPLIHRPAFLYIMLGLWAAYAVLRNFIPALAPV